MLKNSEVRTFFEPLSAHSDVATALLSSLKRLGEYEIVQANSNDYGAFYAVTSQIAFCGVSGMSDTYWRLCPSDVAISIVTGAERATMGPEWVKIECFRSDWPEPDLFHWALRAYNYARTGAQLFNQADR